MPRLDELKEEIKDEEALHGLASAFTEVSAAKIGVLKKKFEKNRGFYQEVSDLYRLVKSSSNLPATASKGVLSVAMTTNNRFYGVINLEVMKKSAVNLWMKKGKTTNLIADHCLALVFIAMILLMV